ncbi:hypothetical protein NDU88_000390 [Pleurodeles waltl]|uniref:Uncharacterized protein n=1 Tax=Pleurodeles waltl TaxID=8319 RepID=A0AAV7Q6W8_PLEWA|nr:hypothetical protein NDU88_000390 [Pleurodeles waltl]
MEPEGVRGSPEGGGVALDRSPPPTAHIPRPGGSRRWPGGCCPHTPALQHLSLGCFQCRLLSLSPDCCGGESGCPRLPAARAPTQPRLLPKQSRASAAEWEQTASSVPGSAGCKHRLLPSSQAGRCAGCKLAHGGVDLRHRGRWHMEGCAGMGTGTGVESPGRCVRGWTLAQVHVCGDGPWHRYMCAGMDPGTGTCVRGWTLAQGKRAQGDVCGDGPWHRYMCAGMDPGTGTCVRGWTLAQVHVCGDGPWHRHVCAGTDPGTGTCVRGRTLAQVHVCGDGPWHRYMCAGMNPGTG